MNMTFLDLIKDRDQIRLFMNLATLRNASDLADVISLAFSLSLAISLSLSLSVCLSFCLFHLGCDCKFKLTEITDLLDHQVPGYLNDKKTLSAYKV